MQKLRVTVNGKAYEVEVELLDETGAGGGSPAAESKAPPPPAPVAAAGPAASAGGGVPSPLSAQVISIAVAVGQQVREGENLVVLEAMKMNSYVTAPRGGTVERILVKPGDSVDEGQDLLHLN